MASIYDIQAYAVGKARNKIVFCPTCIEGLDYKDIGYELASLLQQGCDKENALSKLVNQSEENTVIGKYLAVRNVGILFEPCLKINIESMLEQQSKNKTFVICAEGSFSGNTFLFKGDCKSQINLEGLSHIHL